MEDMYPDSDKKIRHSVLAIFNCISYFDYQSFACSMIYYLFKLKYPQMENAMLLVNNCLEDLASS